MSWTCGCGCDNDAAAHFCSQCGSPQAEAAAPPAATAPEAPPASGDPNIEFGTDARPVPEANKPHHAIPESQEGAPKKKSKALLIIVIIVVLGLLGVCVIGIIAAIAIPNFLAAANKGKQARAVADLREVGAACEAYKTDKGSYPDTGHNEGSYYTTVSIFDLKQYLEPAYIKEVPVKDPWGGTYAYGVSQDNSEFTLTCDGSDGKSTLESIPESPVTTSCYEDDIVFENGDFVQKPEGPQKKCG